MAMRQRNSLDPSIDILARMARVPEETAEPGKLARAAFLVWVMAQPDPLDTRQAASLLIGTHGNAVHPVVQEFIALLRQTLHRPRRRNRGQQRLI